MDDVRIAIPECSLVFLIGASGSGKSTFAKRHFKKTEVLSSDFLRGLISDDENDQSATQDAFEILHLVAEKRMASGLLTVIDATNVRPDARKPLLDLAHEYDFKSVAIVFDVPLELCRQWNSDRPDRRVPEEVIIRQQEFLKASLPNLLWEGFSEVHILKSMEQIDAVVMS